MKGSSRELHGDWSWKNSVYYSLTYVDTGLCLLNSARILILIYQSDYDTYMLRQYSFGSTLTAVKYRLKLKHFTCWTVSYNLLQAYLHRLISGHSHYTTQFKFWVNLTFQICSNTTYSLKLLAFAWEVFFPGMPFLPLLHFIKCSLCSTHPPYIPKEDRADSFLLCVPLTFKLTFNPST